MSSEQTEIAGVASKIYLIRGMKVMLHFDLADLYEVPKKRLSEQVRRNSYRFPADFMFPLTKQEFINFRTQFASKKMDWRGSKNPPLAFTEQGIAMLSSVLNSRRAIEVNIAIMRMFAQLRAVSISNHELEKRITKLESKYDGQFKIVFDAIREVLSSHPVPRKRVIGLGEEEG